MNSWEIAKFIEYFNIAAICLIAIFAVLGVLALISKKANLKAFRGGMFTIAFGLASLAAFALEATVFNFQHYLKFFAGPELHTTEVSAENPNIVLTSDGTRAELLTVQVGDTVVPSGGLVFKNLDRKVTSVFIGIDFKDNETVQAQISWSDEDRPLSYIKTLYRGLPHENYAVIQPVGKVSELSVRLGPGSGESSVDLVSVALNKPVPFYFSGLRLFVVSLLLFAVFVFLRKDLRGRASYYLFEYRFNPASKKQNYAFALLVALLILFSWACVYTTPATYPFIKGPLSEQYNKYLVDALLDGRLWLDYGDPAGRLGAERPYSRSWLIENGYQEYVHFVGDWAWYNGKYYCYYGVVPVVLFFVPYKMITGGYLSLYAAVFLFVSVAVCFLAALWRWGVKKYMPDARFAFFMLSFAALFFTLLLFYFLRYPSVWSTVQVAGLMFVSAGVFLLLKSVEGGKVCRLKLFFACLCLAFAVGSRPNLVLASLLVPLVLWKYRSWKLLLFIAVPYVIIALPICIYNYVRFESVTSFGIEYTVGVGGGYSNPIGKATRVFTNIAYYFIHPNYYSLRFPFVEYVPVSSYVVQGAFMYRQLGGGLINLPIVFCLFYLFKKDFRAYALEAFRLSASFLVVGLAILCGTSYFTWFHPRYMVDFVVFFTYPSLFCAYFWSCGKNSGDRFKTRLKITYVLLAVSILACLCLFVPGDTFSPQDPALYRYLERSLGIFRDV